MNVEEFLGMPLMRNAEVITGSVGLDRTVTWCVLDEVIDFESWLMPGTLVVYSGMRKNYDFEEELSFCFSYEAAAIILIGAQEFVNDENILACIENDMPVIRMPAGLNLINFTRRVSRILSGDVNEEEREEEWLKDLCLTQGTRPNEIVGAYYGWSPECDYTCVTFKAQNELKFTRVQRENHLMVAKSIVVHKGACDAIKPLTFIAKDTLVTFIPFPGNSSLGLRHKKIMKLMSCVEKVFADLEWEVSVGSTTNDLGKLAESFYDAARVRSFVKKVERNVNPVFYEEFSLEMLCLSVPQVELRKNADLILKPIRDDQELMDTLAIYLEMGENGRKTASKLYVHPSTLRYRIHKIEKILDMNLDDSWVRYRLRMAMLIDNYLHDPQMTTEMLRH